MASFVAKRLREAYPLKEDGGAWSYQGIADELGTNKPQVHKLLNEGKGWGEKLEHLVANKLFGGSVDRLRREAAAWWATAQHQEPAPEPTLADLFALTRRLPGLDEWIGTAEGRQYRPSQIMQVGRIYEATGASSRHGDARPAAGWGAFFRDALSGQLDKPRPGAEEALAQLEASQLSSATRRMLPKRKSKT